MIQVQRQRNVSWEQYGISKFRYRELKYFCMQYREKKEKIRRGLTRGSAVSSSAAGLSKVEQQAINNIRYEKDVRMIEEAAAEAHKELAQYILMSVINDMTYEDIMKKITIPYGKTDFYGARRYFYYILDEKMKSGDK